MTETPEVDPGAIDRRALVEAILSSAPDGMVVVDDSGTIRLATRQLARMFGYDVSELVGSRVETLVPSDHRTDHAELRDAYAQDPTPRPMSAHQALSGLRRDGTTFDIEVSLSPLAVEGTPLFIAVVRDVTERRRAEARIADAERELEVIGERERIARDLHDTVIQDLFATGMSLQATLRRIDDPAAAERISDAIDGLDDTIRRIRTVIFGLSAHSSWGSGVPGEILKIVADDGRLLGFAPSVTFDGSLDALEPLVAEALIATVQEGMANVVRHARATTVDLTVAASTELAVTLTDNGVGVDPDAIGGRGLDNMRARAEDLGGSFCLSPGADGGTQLEFRVPLSP